MIARVDERSKGIAELTTVWSVKTITNDRAAALIFGLNQALSFLLKPGDFYVEVGGVSF